MSAEQTTDVVRLTNDERQAVLHAVDAVQCHYGTAADALAVVERIVADRLHEALHASWLAIHVRRFDGPEPPEYGERTWPDSIYKGILLAEKALGDVATARGIDYHALRTPVETKGADRG